LDFLSAKLIVNLALFITPMFKLHEGHFIKYPKTNEYRACQNLCSIDTIHNNNLYTDIFLVLGQLNPIFDNYQIIFADIIRLSLFVKEHALQSLLLILL
jgi:hypothetical protein